MGDVLLNTIIGLFSASKIGIELNEQDKIYCALSFEGTHVDHPNKSFPLITGTLEGLGTLAYYFTWFPLYVGNHCGNWVPHTVPPCSP